jgi:hypothetical protein
MGDIFDCVNFLPVTRTRDDEGGWRQQGVEGQAI